MVAHEYAHGYAALKQGDDTAYKLGRLTWNPIKHIDLRMTIIMPIFLWWASGYTFTFGGAKPIPVVPSLFRNYVRGDIIVSLAGIAANCALAIIGTLAVIGFGIAGHAIPAASDTLALLQYMFGLGVMINVMLAWFNLMPIPPLDGSHVAKHLLPASWAIHYERFSKFGIIVLIVVLWLPWARRVLDIWMWPAVQVIKAALRLATPYMLPSPWTI